MTSVCRSWSGVPNRIRGSVVTQVHAGAARASDENLWSTLTYELQAEGSKIPFGSRSQRPSVHVRTGHAGAARASENLWSRTSTLEPHGRPRVCGHARPRWSRTGVRESVVTRVHAGHAGSGTTERQSVSRACAASGESVGGISRPRLSSRWFDRAAACSASTAASSSEPHGRPNRFCGHTRPR